MDEDEEEEEEDEEDEEEEGEDVIGHGILAGSSLANCRGSLNKPIADVCDDRQSSWIQRLASFKIQGDVEDTHHLRLRNIIEDSKDMVSFRNQ